MQMAQQDELEWFKGELLRVEQNIQEVEASIIAAIRAKEDSAVIAEIKKKRDRLVQEKLKLQGELGSIVQAQLTSLAGETVAVVLW